MSTTAAARCPVCEDILTFGITLKLHQSVTCPTCLANLQVVSINPFELDLPAEGGYSVRRKNGQPQAHKKSRQQKPVRRVSENLGGEDEFDDFDDFTLERRLRYKSDRERRKLSR